VSTYRGTIVAEVRRDFWFGFCVFRRDLFNGFATLQKE